MPAVIEMNLITADIAKMKRFSCKTTAFEMLCTCPKPTVILQFQLFILQGYCKLGHAWVCMHIYIPS